MADKKISELDLALLINDDAEFPFSQDNAEEPTTFKGRITQLGTKIAEDITFSNLRTTSKKLVGAINELLSLGSPIIIGTTAPTSSVGADGNLYVQYTAGTGGADDEVDGIFVKIDGAWCEIETGGGGAGGHTIVDNAGTDLAQRTNLQFLGAYSEDNSTDDTTEVNVVREMTKAEFNQLSATEKVGFINITDETSQINATEIPIESGSATNTKDYIDTVDSKIPTFDSNTLSGGTSITVNRSQIYKYGKLAFVTCVFTTTASITGDSTVLNLPAGYTAKNFTDIVGSDNSGNTKLLYASGNTIKINGSLTSGAVIFLNATYQLA